MADHSELLAEMLILEQMGTQERQKLAKKRRLQQIKKWSQREKEWMAKEKQMNKRLANKISEENNGLNLKHYTQYPLSEKSPTIRPMTINQKSNITNNNKPNNYNNNNSNNLNNNNVVNNCNGIIKYKQNNVNKSSAVPSSIINNNILRKNSNNISNSRSVSLNGLDAQDLGSRSIHSKVHFDSGVMLLEAAGRNDLNEVKRLLMLGVSPDSTNHDGLTTLHQGCIEASEPMINLLLEFGANVDARDTEQWTPLHAACTCGHLNLVRILVERGADLLAINGDGNMPFDLCEDEQTLDYLESQMVAKGITQEMIDVARVSTEMQMISEIQRLINNDVDIKSITYANNITPAHVAAANGYLSALKFLIKHGADMTAQDNDLWQPLHGVACWGNEQHIKIIELLAESGASLDAKTINDETVFDLCDNEHILEKLNEIKDEIESKQAASEADRLRRTQSRTNSRIHSIRRTSTRDKNQLSRRDAREEALLRSESSGVLPTSSDVSNTTDIHPLKAFNDDLTSATVANHDDDGDCNGNSANNSTGRIRDPVIFHGEMPEHGSQKNVKVQEKRTSTTNTIEQPIRTDQRQDSGIETSYLSTDLDAQTTNNLTTSNSSVNQHKQTHDDGMQHINHNNSTSTHNGSQQNYNIGTDEQPDNNSYSNHRNCILPNYDIKQQLLTADDMTTMNRNNTNTLQLDHHQQQGSASKQNRVTFNGSSSTNNCQVDMPSMSTSPQFSKTNDNNHRRTSTSDPNHYLYASPNVQVLGHDQSGEQAITTVTSGSKIIVQFNSTNYTLSNLKKQRSDFRMRTTSMAGFNNNPSSVVGGANTTKTANAAPLNKISLDHSEVNALEPSVKQDFVDHPQSAHQQLQQQAWSANNGIVSSSTTKSKLNNDSNKNNGNSKFIIEDRPLQSPTSSLRRFRGEPSELIGGEERGVKHGCCSIV